MARKSAVASRWNAAASAPWPVRPMSHAESANTAIEAAANAGSARAARPGPIARRRPSRTSDQKTSGMPRWNIAGYTWLWLLVKATAQHQWTSNRAANSMRWGRKRSPARQAANIAAPGTANHRCGCGVSRSGSSRPRRCAAANGVAASPILPSCPCRNGPACAPGPIFDSMDPTIVVSYRRISPPGARYSLTALRPSRSAQQSAEKAP